MPYNYFGDLKKGEVAVKLRKMGYDVKNVHALNLIMEEMGLLENCGGYWLTTDAGLKYSLGDTPAYNEIAWHPSLVDAVANYLD